jgi:hypothetical protein
MALSFMRAAAALDPLYLWKYTLSTTTNLASAGSSVVLMTS